MDYLLFLQNIRTALGGCLDRFFLAITSLAESPAPFLFLAWIYWCVDKESGQMMALSTGFNCAAGQALKGICHIDRPWIRDTRITPVQQALPNAGGYSFPSGHTIRAGSAYGLFGMDLILKKRKKWKKSLPDESMKTAHQQVSFSSLDKSPYYQAGFPYEESNDPYPLQIGTKTHGYRVECNDSEPCK